MAKENKTFSYHWGSGYISEEAQVESPHHLPTLQLMQFTDGPEAGSVNIRSCHYSHRGPFMRSPLLMSADDVDLMREALRATPALKAFLRRLVED